MTCCDSEAKAKEFDWSRESRPGRMGKWTLVRKLAKCADPVSSPFSNLKVYSSSSAPPPSTTSGAVPPEPPEDPPPLDPLPPEPAPSSPDLDAIFRPGLAPFGSAFRGAPPL